MGARLQNTIYDANGQDWTITVYDTEYSTTALPIDITSAKIQWQASSSERFAPVLPSVADISFRVDGAVLNAFVTDFIGAPEQRFRLTIYKGVNLFWVGNVQTDNVRKQDKEYPYIFTLRAADGLAALKDVDYNDDGTGYDGFERITEHLINALTKVGTSDLFGANFLSVAAHWYSAEHSATTVDPIHETRFNHRRFVKLDSNDNKSYSSCYDVIESICEAFGARLYLSDGAYRFVQVNQYEGNNVKYFHYASDKTSSGSTAQTVYRKTDGTDVIRLFGGSFEYYPALRGVTINYNHLQAQSLIGTNDITSSDYTGDILDSQSGSSTLLISTSIKYSSSEPTNELFEPLRLHIRLKVQVGSHYLTRTATSFPVSYSATTWETTPGYYEIVTPILESNGAEYIYNITALNTPPFPFDSQLIVSGTYYAAYTPNGLPYSPTSVSVKFFNSYIEVVPSGFVEDRSNKTTYSVTNDQTNNSKRIEINTELGDGPSFNALGALQVWDGSEWVVSTGWAVDALTGTNPIGQLLAQETIKTQAFPCEIISATYNGFVSPLYTIYHDSDDYAVRQLNLDLIQGKAQGLFFECDSTGAAYTDKDEESSFEVDEEISPISPINVPIKNPVSEAQLDPTLQTFAQIQEIIVTDTAISAGDPITSIQIAPSGNDDLIKTNDVITLIDQVTGQTQEFTVTADVLGTDTSIPVSSDTADYDFASGSSITFSQESLIIKINNVEVTAGVNSFTAGQGLVVDSSTGDITAQIDLSQITNIVTYDNTHYLIGTTAGGLMTKGNVLTMFANLLSAGSNITLTNTGTQIEIASTATGGVTAITTSAGLDNSGTGTVNIALDLNELSTLAFGLQYNDYLVGVSGVTNYKATVLQTFNGLITAGAGISVTNTGTSIQIASTGGSGVDSISVGTGLDGGGTGAVSITLDFSELPVLFYGLEGTHTVAGVSGSGTTVGSKVVDMVDNVLVAGTGISLAKNGTAGTVTISSTASGGTDGDANWDDASVNLQYINVDMSSTVISSTYATKRHFTIGATVTSSSTSDTLILLPAPSSTYQYHQIWVGASSGGSSHFIRVSSGGFVRTLTDGELVCVKCMRFSGTWYWIAT